MLYNFLEKGSFSCNIIYHLHITASLAPKRALQKVGHADGIHVFFSCDRNEKETHDLPCHFNAKISAILAKNASF